MHIYCLNIKAYLDLIRQLLYPESVSISSHTQKGMGIYMKTYYHVEWGGCLCLSKIPLYREGLDYLL